MTLQGGAPRRLRSVAWRFFGGLDARGRPTWTSDERGAAIVQADAHAEVSVVFEPRSQVWLMLHLGDCEGAACSIQMRYAYEPWGPFHDGGVVFTSPTTRLVDPAAVEGTRMTNNLVKPYAPYLVSNWFSGDGNALTIYYVMSSYYPNYEAFLMKAVVDIYCVSAGSAVFR